MTLDPLDPQYSEKQPVEKAIIAVGLGNSTFLAIDGKVLEYEVENLGDFPDQVIGDMSEEPGIYYWQGRPAWEKESWDSIGPPTELVWQEEQVRVADRADLDSFGLTRIVDAISWRNNYSRS